MCEMSGDRDGASCPQPVLLPACFMVSVVQERFWRSVRGAVGSMGQDSKLMEVQASSFTCSGRIAAWATNLPLICIQDALMEMSDLCRRNERSLEAGQQGLLAGLLL